MSQSQELPGRNYIINTRMCKVNRSSAILLICISSLIQHCRAEPEVSVGSSRSSAPKSLVNWGPSYAGSAIGGPGLEALFAPSQKRGREFNFGLGKRSPLNDEQEEMDGAYYDDDNNNRNMWMKRVSGSGVKAIRGSGRLRNGYSFGLGKRGWFSSISYPASTPYLGDIKRRYSFGLGKRSVSSQESAASGDADLSLSGNK